MEREEVRWRLLVTLAGWNEKAVVEYDWSRSKAAAAELENFMVLLRGILGSNCCWNVRLLLETKQVLMNGGDPIMQTPNRLYPDSRWWQKVCTQRNERNRCLFVLLSSCSAFGGARTCSSVYEVWIFRGRKSAAAQRCHRRPTEPLVLVFFASGRQQDCSRTQRFPNGRQNRTKRTVVASTTSSSTFRDPTGHCFRLLDFGGCSNSAHCICQRKVTVLLLIDSERKEFTVTLDLLQ
jgi:hypothetical protein